MNERMNGQTGSQRRAGGFAISIAALALLGSIGTWGASAFATDNPVEKSGQAIPQDSESVRTCFTEHGVPTRDLGGDQGWVADKQSDALNAAVVACVTEGTDSGLSAEAARLVSEAHVNTVSECMTRAGIPTMAVFDADGTATYRFDGARADDPGVQKAMGTCSVAGQRAETAERSRLTEAGN